MANTQKFKTVTTNLGRNAVAIAHATGSSIKLTHMAVGDGNGQSVEPNSAMTALVHEVYRGQINDIVINSEVQGEFTAELLIPQSTGGFFIREVGLFFEDGTMFAIGNTPLTEKTELSSGAATDLLVRMIIRVLDAGTIEIFIDPAQVLATRDYVERLLNGHETDPKAHEELFSNVQEQIENSSNLKAGDLLISSRKSVPGCFLCDSSAVGRKTYTDLFDEIGTTYGEGDGSTTFNLPDFRGRFIQGANGDLGSVKEAGLPNITGEWWTDAMQYCAHATGAFTTGTNRTSGYMGLGGKVPNGGPKLDASRSSPVYGRSETVQPPAIALNIFIKY